jgi:hypothetical protein
MCGSLRRFPGGRRSIEDQQNAVGKYPQNPGSAPKSDELRQHQSV